MHCIRRIQTSYLFIDKVLYLREVIRRLVKYFYRLDKALHFKV
nr:MAG TPA: hypothetical protein [Bacteriophage sp.]